MLGLDGMLDLAETAVVGHVDAVEVLVGIAVVRIVVVEVVADTESAEMVVGIVVVAHAVAWDAKLDVRWSWIGMLVEVVVLVELEGIEVQVDNEVECWSVLRIVD